MKKFLFAVMLLAGCGGGAGWFLYDDETMHNDTGVRLCNCDGKHCFCLEPNASIVIGTVPQK